MFLLMKRICEVRSKTFKSVVPKQFLSGWITALGASWMSRWTGRGKLADKQADEAKLRLGSKGRQQRDPPNGQSCLE